MDLRLHLSPPQYEAATHIDGPVCILAGAGSGKTRVITHRIAHLILNQRAHPSTILAVTFTNKAAGEMRHRVDALVPGRGRSVLVGTFHGMAARFLRQFGDAVGLPRSFVIYDQDDAARLMKRIIVDEMNGSKDLVRPFLSRIDGWQSEGLHPHEVPSTPWNKVEEDARAAYARYVERLAAMSAIDFGGLLVKLLSLLKTEAGREITGRVRHLLVDEYQDTNRVQAEITHILAKTADTLAVVGDDDQAIYGWRGASADNLKRFLDGHFDAKLVRLEDNYRSTGHILDAANGVISNNELRLGKTLRPMGEEGRRVRILANPDDIEEARRVALDILDECRRGRSLEEMAILYRANASSRLFEEELRRLRLPYRLVGGVRFYDRKEVKDVLATVRVALNPRSDVDTVRMIGAVPRGIGDTSLKKLQNAAQKQNVPLIDVMRDETLMSDAGVPARTAKKARALAEEVTALGQAASDGLLAKDTFAKAIEVSGVADRLEAEATPESEGRLENLAALLDAAAQHEELKRSEGRTGTVFSFLEDAALLSGDENDPKADVDEPRLTLMTLHAAKGLEYDVVYMVGMEEHGFPHTRALKEDATVEALEEERRLAYVGITRARQRLLMSFAKRRMVQGTPKVRTASRFLRELPPDVVEGDRLPPPTRTDMLNLGHELGDGMRVEYDADVAFGGNRFFQSGGHGRGAARPKNPSGHRTHLGGPPVDREALLAPVRRRLEEAKASRLDAASDDGSRPPSEASSNDDAPHVVLDPDHTTAHLSTLRAGERVSHAVFGEGRIVGLRGAGKNEAALVRFDEERAPRVIILRHLTTVEDDVDTVRVVLDPVDHDGREP